MPLVPVFVWINAVNATVFPIIRYKRFHQAKRFLVAVLGVTAVNAAVSPIERYKCR